MKSLTVPMNYINKELNDELKKFNILEVLKRDLNTMDLLLLNEILMEYPLLEKVTIEDEEYIDYNYKNLNKRYKDILYHENVWSKAKSRLEAKGIITTKKINGKLLIKLELKEINNIVW